MAKIEQSVDINSPVSTAYQQLCRFEDYPQFMDNVQEIKQQGANHLHWCVEKNGKEIEWEAEITDQVEDKLIAWRNTTGAKQVGRISLQSSATDKTRITMSLETDDVATGEAGKSAKQKLERDLQRLKEYIETAADTHDEYAQAPRVGTRTHAEAGAGGRDEGLSNNGNTNGNGGNQRYGYTQETQHTERRDQPFVQQPGRSTFSLESTMSEQTGSMQFSGESSQSRSPSQQQSTGPMAQIWAQPVRMMSQVSEAFGQMPGRMMEQEASMLQRSFGAPQAWLPNMISAWEEPFVMIRKISEEMDQFFGKIMQRPISKIAQTRNGSGVTSQKWTPSIEVTQRGNEMIICADLPGLTKADVQVQVLDDKLTIEGERVEESNVNSEHGYHRTERSYGRFYRTIPLPEGVDRHRVDAKMRDGVLEISMPLRQQQSRGMVLEIREAEEGELREQRELRLTHELQNEERHQQQNQQPRQQSVGAQASAKHNESSAQDDRPAGKGGSVGVKAEVKA